MSASTNPVGKRMKGLLAKNRVSEPANKRVPEPKHRVPEPVKAMYQNRQRSLKSLNYFRGEMRVHFSGGFYD